MKALRLKRTGVPAVPQVCRFCDTHGSVRLVNVMVVHERGPAPDYHMVETTVYAGDHECMYCHRLQ